MALASMTVALVGRRLPHNENLGLAYLRAALTQAGASVTTHYVNDAAELARAAAAILAARPAVVGLSLADGGSALLPLALGEALSRAGFRGHITSGGQFATLARSFLLARYPWLDSVVRFAGEVPIVEIAARVARGEPVSGVPGVTTREGDGPPAAVLDPTQITLRPLRDELPEILGHRAAHITASRGCRGRCHYCGPAALQTEERAEGARAGISVRRLTEGGVGGVRRREIDAVCDEVAYLHAERGVRYFYFVDEHLLPYDEGEALAWIAAFREGLAARRVGPLGIGAMLRADRITPAVIRAFAEAGLVRLFIGLELATPAEARTFGRTAPTEREIDLLRVCAESGVTTVSNLMLVHPYSTPATVHAGLDLLARVPAGVFEATRMMVYHGTRLHQRIGAEGRLLGNPLRYGYTYSDPVMERFAEIFSRLRGEAFWDYSVAYRTHDVHLALSLGRRLSPERVPADLPARLDAVRDRVNHLYVEGYRRGLSLAIAGGGFAEAGALVESLAGPVRDLGRELDAIESLILSAAPPRSRLFAPMRAAAASAITFALGGSIAACGGNVIVDVGPGAGGGATTSTGVGGAGGTVPTCVDDGFATEQEVKAAIANGAACFSGNINIDSAAPPEVGFNFYAYGNTGYLGLGSCYTPAAEQAVAAQENDAKKALADACISTSSSPVYTWVEGGSTSDAEVMVKAIESACSSLLDWDYKQFTIVLDKSGKVTTVNPGSPAAAALAECVFKALSGLTFPCLASFEVCPEYAIAE